MTSTEIVTRLDNQVKDVEFALDVASTAFIRAQELAAQDPTGAASARLAAATAGLQGNVRMLADMFTSPASPAGRLPALTTGAPLTTGALSPRATVRSGLSKLIRATPAVARC